MKTHNINIGNIAGNATIKVGEGTTNLTAKVAENGTATIKNNKEDQKSELSLKDGSSLNSAKVTYGSSLTISSDNAINLQNASFNGSVSVTGSEANDTFIIQSMEKGILYLTGNGGVDTYKFDNSVRASVSDFGFVKDDGTAINDKLDADIIKISAPESIKLVNGKVQIGDLITIASDIKDEVVYAKLQVGEESEAQTYQIGASGATLVKPTEPTDDSDTTPVDTDTDDSSADDSSADTIPSGDTVPSGADTVDSGSVEYETILGGDTTYISLSGSTGGDSTTFDLSNINEATYVDVSTGSSVVKGVTTYDGYNDNTATVINTSVPVENMTQNISRSTLVLTDTNGNEVTVNGVRAGDAIKLGDADNPSVVVLGGESNTSVKASLADADYFLGASGENTTLDFSKTTKTVIDLSGDSGLDGSTYKYVKGVTGSAAGESLLISGNDAVVLQAAGENDTLFGAGKGSDTLVSASGKSTNFVVQSGIGEDVAKGFSFGAGSNSDKIIIDNTIDYNAGIVKASSGAVQIGNSKGSIELDGASGNSALIRYDYGNGDHQGVILADVSDGGGEITFNEVANLIVGQGEKTTLVAGANDDVKAISDDMPAGIGWNSNYIVSNVGVVDASASNMGAVNGQDGVDNKVIASTGANIGRIWICGGIGANFTDTGNDTLVASGQGHDEIFVGATMGNDVIQNVASNDKVTFVNTKVSDYGGDINNIITIDAANNTFSAVFASDGKTTTIKGTVASSMNNTTNLTFHFDDVDYVWNGSKLEQA